MTLGQRLRRARLARGMTQRELALPKYTPAHVSTIESGRRHPSRAALRYFAEKLGISEEELISGRPPHAATALAVRLHKIRKSISAGDIAHARMALKRLMREARRYSLQDIEARAHEMLALCELRAGNVEAALAKYDDVERLLVDEPLTTRVGARVGKAMALWQLGDLQHAIFLLENAREALTRTGIADPGALFQLHAALVGLYFEVGAYDRSYEAASKSLELAPECKDPEALGRMYVCAAGTHLARGNFEHARALQWQAEALFRQADLRLEVGQAHLALGFGLAQQDALVEARRHFDTALQIFAEIGSRLDEARVRNEIAKLERKLGRGEEARENLNASLRLLRGDVDVVEEALAHRELGVIEASSNPDAAEKHLRRAIELYGRAGTKRELATAHKILGDMYYDRGDALLALEEYRVGIAVLDEQR